MDLRAIEVEKGGQSFRLEFVEDGDHKVSDGEVFRRKFFTDAVWIDEMRMSDRSIGR